MIRFVRRSSFPGDAELHSSAAPSDYSFAKVTRELIYNRESHFCLELSETFHVGALAPLGGGSCPIFYFERT